VEARFESFDRFIFHDFSPMPSEAENIFTLRTSSTTGPSTPGLGNSACGEHRNPSDFFYDTGVDTIAEKENVVKSIKESGNGV
jgi:hypothetical protein